MAKENHNQAIFLDRDGTINEHVGYLRDPLQLKLLPEAGRAIKLLNENGLRVIIVSNQSGIARGYFTEDDLSRIHHKLEEELAKEGAFIDAIYYCPHHAEVGNETYGKACDCRKPNSKMLRQAALDFEIDLKRSYMVGDQPSDIKAGDSVGCKTVLLLPDRKELTSDKEDLGISPSFITEDLAKAVDWILADICSTK